MRDLTDHELCLDAVERTLKELRWQLGDGNTVRVSETVSIESLCGQVKALQLAIAAL